MPIHDDRPPYAPDDCIDGKYRVVKVIGEGGMSVIYGCTDITCGKQVAVKTFRPSIARQRVYSAAEMRNEAEVLVRLHERTAMVVEVFTAGLTEDRHRLPYFVMEWLRGGTLRRHIQQREREGLPFEINEVTAAGIDAAVTLVHAHALGIIHRDLKPENFFIARDRDGSWGTRLLDFGVSATVEQGAVAKPRVFVGSRPYAAPEQLQGEPVTVAVDVYSLGLMLFEMLTFTLPHDRRNRDLAPEHIAANAYAAPAPVLEAHRSDVPARLASLIGACLSWKPDGRPTAADVARSLRAVSAEFEGQLLGGHDASARTDVDGTPIALLHENVTEPSRTESRAGSDAPLAATATTAPGPSGGTTSPRPGDEDPDEEILAARPGPASLTGSAALPRGNGTLVDPVPFGALMAQPSERAPFVIGTKPPAAPAATLAEPHPAPVLYAPARAAPARPGEPSPGPPPAKRPGSDQALSEAPGALAATQVPVRSRRRRHAWPSSVAWIAAFTALAGGVIASIPSGWRPTPAVPLPSATNAPAPPAPLTAADETSTAPSAGLPRLPTEPPAERKAVAEPAAASAGHPLSVPSLDLSAPRARPSAAARPPASGQSPKMTVDPLGEFKSSIDFENDLTAADASAVVHPPRPTPGF